MNFVVSIAVAQFSPGEDKTANLAALRSLAREAADRGADLVLAPEYSMFTAGRLDDRYRAAAEPVDGPFVDEVRSIAAETGIVVACGIAESRRDDSHIFNTVVVADADRLLATYRKIHLYDAFGFHESDIVSPGPIDEPALFSLAGATLGIQTCYDLRFPEVTRRLAVGGAQAVLIPAQWIPGPLKEDHWTTLIRARAIENTIYVFAADQASPTGAGNSIIVDPMGVTVANLGDQIGTVSGAISEDRVLEVRRKNPSLAHRRLS